MNKLVCILLSAVVAVAVAEDTSMTDASGFTLPEFVPMVATLCSQGCPAICQASRTFCFSGGLVDCDAQKAQCDAACAETCPCIAKCGPDCDQFEANCKANGVPELGGIFCPITGGVCDVTCVIGCPQKTFANIIGAAFAQQYQTFQSLIQGLLTPPAATK